MVYGNRDNSCGGATPAVGAEGGDVGCGWHRAEKAVPHRQTLGPPSPPGSGLLHWKTPSKQQFALEKSFPGSHSRGCSLSPADEPWLCCLVPCLGTSPCIAAPGRCPGETKLARELQSDASKALTATFSLLFHGSDTKTALPAGRALWAGRLTPRF